MREFDDNIPARAFDNFQVSRGALLPFFINKDMLAYPMTGNLRYVIFFFFWSASLQFVNFTAIMSKNVPQPRKETEFALAALMEIPSQYKATLELNLLG